MLHFLPFCSAAQQYTGSDQIARDKRALNEHDGIRPRSLLSTRFVFQNFIPIVVNFKKSISLAHLSFFFFYRSNWCTTGSFRRSSIIVKISRIFSRVSLADGKSMEQLAQRAATSLINPSTSSSMNVALMELTGEKIWLHQRERMRTEMGGGDVLTQLSCHFTVGISVNARWIVWKSDFVR